MRTIKEIIKEDLNEAQWVGEDGAAVAYCKTQIGAWRKIRKLMRDDVGDNEADQISIDQIGEGFLHQFNEDGTLCMMDGEESWCVKLEPSPVKLWWYHGD